MKMNKYILSTRTLSLVHELIARLNQMGEIDDEAYMIILELESFGYSNRDIGQMIKQEVLNVRNKK